MYFQPMFFRGIHLRDETKGWRDYGLYDVGDCEVGVPLHGVIVDTGAERARRTFHIYYTLNMG